MSQDNAPNFRDSSTCSSCQHSCFRGLDGPMYCTKWEFYFSWVRPTAKICDDYKEEDE